jgi:hypothetical protein
MLSSSARASDGSSTGVCPDRHDVPGPAHRRGRVDWHDLAGDEPIEQLPDRGEPLLDARRREFARAGFDPGGDVHRLHRADRRHAGARVPGQKFIGGASSGALSPVCSPACGGCFWCRLAANQPLGEGPASTRLSPNVRTLLVSATGHKDQFPRPRLSAGYGFRKETIAGMRGNGRDAPIPDLPALAPEPRSGEFGPARTSGHSALSEPVVTQPRTFSLIVPVYRTLQKDYHLALQRSILPSWKQRALICRIAHIEFRVGRADVRRGTRSRSAHSLPVVQPR